MHLTFGFGLDYRHGRTAECSERRRLQSVHPDQNERRSGHHDKSAVARVISKVRGRSDAHFCRPPSADGTRSPASVLHRSSGVSERPEDDGKHRSIGERGERGRRIRNSLRDGRQIRRNHQEAIPSLRPPSQGIFSLKRSKNHLNITHILFYRLT